MKDTGQGQLTVSHDSLPAGGPGVMPYSDADAGEPRKLGVMFKGMGGGDLKIASVVPGSLAETAGFLPGDKLVSVNDRPTADYDMSEFGKLFRSSTPLSFEVERGGELIILRIP